MSKETKHFYDFGNFRLDPSEKVLLCGGEFISITPKVFETLRFLVENAGRLVEKDELMQQIWHDQFVEESNLSFNIKMLRKALGDNAQNPRFVKTVPTRGYRFIAKVQEIFGEQTEPRRVAQGDFSSERNHCAKIQRTSCSNHCLLRFVYRNNLYRLLAYAEAQPRSRRACFVCAVRFGKLSTNRKSFHAVVSPCKSPMRQTEKNEKKLVSCPRPVRIGDNKFAPDGKNLAFAAGQPENAANEFGFSQS